MCFSDFSQIFLISLLSLSLALSLPLSLTLCLLAASFYRSQHPLMHSQLNIVRPKGQQRTNEPRTCIAVEVGVPALLPPRSRSSLVYASKPNRIGFTAISQRVPWHLVSGCVRLVKIDMLFAVSFPHLGATLGLAAPVANVHHAVEAVLRAEPDPRPIKPIKRRAGIRVGRK